MMARGDYGFRSRFYDSPIPLPEASARNMPVYGQPQITFPQIFLISPNHHLSSVIHNTSTQRVNEMLGKYSEVCLSWR